MKRLMLTGTVVSGLLGLFMAYRVASGWLLARPERQVTIAVAEPHERLSSSAENVRIAREHLPHVPWAIDSQYQIRSDHTYLYANEWMPEGNRGEIRFRPLAVVMVNERKGKTQITTMVAESALLKFASQFDVRSPNPGRIIAGALEGEVSVAGPEGLMIKGRNFYLSESAARMYSDHPVSFALGPHRGTAGQLQAELIPAEYTMHSDRPAIIGLKSVRLRRNVKMEVVLKNKQEPLPLHIKTAGSFEYLVEDEVAIFEAERAQKDDVLVYREPVAGQTDWLRCERLTLGFVPRKPEDVAQVPAPPTAKPEEAEFRRIRTDLRFASLKAEGRLVRTVSTQQNFKGEMTSLVYNAVDRILVMSDPKGVQLWHGENRLQSPGVQIAIGEADTIGDILCAGPGVLETRDPATQLIQYAAGWKTHLRKFADPETRLDVIELNNQASFRQPGQKTALGADQIRVWVTPLSLAPGRPVSPVASQQSGNLQPDALNIQPRRLLAEKNVAMLSPQLEAEAETLLVDFEGDFNRQPGEKKPESQKSAGNSSEGMLPASGTPSSAANSKPFRMKAGHLKVLMKPDLKTGEPMVSDVWTEKDFQLSQARIDNKPPLDLRGQKLHLKNDGEARQVVHVYGSPAEIRDSGMLIRGPAVHLDRTENLAWVDGAGNIQLPIEKDTSGQMMAQPEILDISWQEKMIFDGRKASFDGNIFASFASHTPEAINNHRMNCQQMEVELTQRILFAQQQGQQPKTDLAVILCKDGVRLESYERKQGLLTQIRRANVWQLRLEPATGAASAIGKGKLQIWRREPESTIQQASASSARANRPLTADQSPWDYTSVDFNGKMIGNIESRGTTFHDRVQVVHGPVDTSVATIHPDQLTKNAGSMRCDSLELIQRQPLESAANSGQKPWMELFANGNTILEGNGFHARADQVSYDQSKGLFILKAVGNREATIWREGPGGGVPQTAKRIEFNPTTGKLDVNQATSAGGSG